MQLTTEQLETLPPRRVPRHRRSSSDATRRIASAPASPPSSPRTPRANIREKASGEVRTAMGLHERDALYAELVRDARLVAAGGATEWRAGLHPAGQGQRQERVQRRGLAVALRLRHPPQRWEDGVPEPHALNLHVFLDDVTEFNGPLYFIPGSHRRGPAPSSLDTETTSYPLWVVAPEHVADLVERGRHCVGRPAPPAPRSSSATAWCTPLPTTCPRGTGPSSRSSTTRCRTR